MKSLILLLLALALTDLTAQTYEQKMQFLDLVNTYRTHAGLKSYSYDFQGDTFVARRVLTATEKVNSSNIFKVLGDNDFAKTCLHYEFMRDAKWFNTEIVAPDTNMRWSSECAAILIQNYVKKHDDLVVLLFESWKSSKDHWNMIMDPDFDRLALKWYSNESILIAHVVIYTKVKI